MNRLANEISQACDALGLCADIGFSLVFSNGHEIQAIARIRYVGAENGMLVVSNYDEVKNYADEICQKKYGFSVLDEPLDNEMLDLDSYMDMFRDWGWCADMAQKPNWM